MNCLWFGKKIKGSSYKSSGNLIESFIFVNQIQIGMWSLGNARDRLHQVSVFR